MVQSHALRRIMGPELREVVITGVEKRAANKAGNEERTGGRGRKKKAAGGIIGEEEEEQAAQWLMASGMRLTDLVRTFS